MNSLPLLCPACEALLQIPLASQCPSCRASLLARVVPESNASAAPAELIGGFKLIQVIGEGGCGVVYLAGQEKPVRRWVAVKVIKPGMDTEDVMQRFEAERQALALLGHPNIARGLDG